MRMVFWALLLLCVPSWGADRACSGRFQVVETKLGPLLLDTATGRIWLKSCPTEGCELLIWSSPYMEDITHSRKELVKIALEAEKEREPKDQK
jgi:hypothetical protein